VRSVRERAAYRIVLCECATRGQPSLGGISCRVPFDAGSRFRYKFESYFDVGYTDHEAAVGGMLRSNDVMSCDD